MKDAQRHGVAVLPIDVARSRLDVRARSGARRRRPRVRLGLRYVHGLREETGRAARRRARARSRFASAARSSRARARARGADELAALAELGALAAIDARARTRRSALWQVAALERDPLLARVGSRAATRVAAARDERARGDARRLPRSGVTTGAHVMAHLRARARARAACSRAAALRDVPDGRLVRTAGHAIVRQRPGTAKGFCFLTLEDETGTSNAVLTPRIFRALPRRAARAPRCSRSAGPLQNVEGVIHVRVRELRRSGRAPSCRGPTTIAREPSA